MFAASEVKLRAQKQQPAMRDLEGGDRARCAENGARPVGGSRYFRRGPLEVERGARPCASQRGVG